MNPGRLNELPRALTEVLEGPWRLDAQDLEALPQPREVRIDAERSAAMDPDRLEAAVAVQEAAVPDRDARIFLGNEGPVKPRGGRPGSPPRGPA